MSFLDKRFLNVMVIVFLSAVTYFWSTYVFCVPFSYRPLLFITITRILSSFLIFNDYSISWSKASNKTILIKSIVNTVAFIVYAPLLCYHGYKFTFLISDYFFYMMAINLSTYVYNFLINRSAAVKIYSVVLYGSGKAGTKLLEEFRNSEYQVRFFIDDDPNAQKRTVDGIRILSSEAMIRRINKGEKIDILIIAMPSARRDRINGIYNEFSHYINKIYRLPSLNDILKNMDYAKQITNVTLEDLLARTPRDLDTEAISNFLYNKTVLITGAGGSIGSEICRQCVKYGVSQLILVDHSEYNLYQITEELLPIKVISIMGSVTDKDKIYKVMANYLPDIVIHAAAYKHVPLCENNASSAIENNIFGTKNIVDICCELKIKKMILISTDKAVRPSSVMGATKRVCELYAQNMSSDKTEIVSVRFGNVLGSSGSVIPKFKHQIEHGGPVTVTDPEVTRYFMLIPEACELVLQAGAIGRGREIFILDMGQPYKIIDLAKKMITLSGRNNISIEFTGLRPGEKLYEELLIDETDIRTKYESITVAKQTKYDIGELNILLEKTRKSDDSISILKTILPEEFKNLQKDKE